LLIKLVDILALVLFVIVFAAWTVYCCSQALFSWSLETVCKWKQRCVEGHVDVFFFFDR